MTINFAYTILYVEDVTKSIEFYQKAFGFQQKFVTPDKDYGELISGQTTIAFASHKLAESSLKDGFIKSDLNSKPMGIELAFSTEEVKKLMELAKNNGAIVVAEITTKPWGQKVGYVRDINGFLIELCTPIQA